MLALITPARLGPCMPWQYCALRKGPSEKAATVRMEVKASVAVWLAAAYSLWSCTHGHFTWQPAWKLGHRQGPGLRRTG